MHRVLRVWYNEGMRQIGVLLTFDEIIKVLIAVQRYADDLRHAANGGSTSTADVLSGMAEQYQALHDNIMNQGSAPTYTRTVGVATDSAPTYTRTVES